MGHTVQMDSCPEGAQPGRRAAMALSINGPDPLLVIWKTKQILIFTLDIHKITFMHTRYLP